MISKYKISHVILVLLAVVVVLIASIIAARGVGFSGAPSTMYRQSVRISNSSDYTIRLSVSGELLRAADSSNRTDWQNIGPTHDRAVFVDPEGEMVVRGRVTDAYGLKDAEHIEYQICIAEAMRENGADHLARAAGCRFRSKTVSLGAGEFSVDVDAIASGTEIDLVVRVD